MTRPRNSTHLFFSAAIALMLLCGGLLLLARVPAAQAASQPVWYQESPLETQLPASAGVLTSTGVATVTTPISNTSILTGTPTATAVPTITITATITPTMPVTATATVTPTLTTTPEPTPGQPPDVSTVAYLPLVARQSPPPPEEMLFCSQGTTGIPDNYPQGATSVITVQDGRLIEDLDVSIYIDHTWVSDLIVRLTHLDTGRSITLIDRPGLPSRTYGCQLDNIGAILDDEYIASVEDQCSSSSISQEIAVAGIFRPMEALNAFRGEHLSGTWLLNVTDVSRNDTGEIKNWCLAANAAWAIPELEPEPNPGPLPAEAQVYGVRAQKQAMPLDCESRVAVDWAGFFGYRIDEFDFFNNLPRSDNPDAGFVGNVYGPWGNIPPQPYGIHADPVAELLRAYRVPAYAHHQMSWDAVRAEITAGRPVYVWTVWSGNHTEAPVHYRSSDNHLSIVARYEHVVIVTGYTPDTVVINDGGTKLIVPLDLFLASWSALGNMAITATPAQ